MATMTTRLAGADVVNSLVHAIFNEGVLEISNELNYNRWGFKDYVMDISDERLAGISGPGIGVVTTEAVQYGSNDNYRDYDVGFTLRKYTSELEVTEELDHWLMKSSPLRRVQQIQSFTQDHLNALKYNIDYDCAQMFFLSTGTTFFTSGDGLSLANAAHTIRKTGGTQSNRLTVDGTAATAELAFSESNLVTAINRMNRFRGMNDVQMRPVQKALVLCSVEASPTVQRVLYSAYGPNTANLGRSSASKEAFSGRGVDIDYAIVDKMPSAYANAWGVVALDRCLPLGGPQLGVGWMPRMNEQWEYSKGTRKNEASTLMGPTALGWQWLAWSNAS